MFCAACGKQTPDDPCVHCGASVLLRGRWRLQEVVGSGTHGTTWRALDTQTGFTVAVKECHLAGLSDEMVQGAHREASVLATLQHPAIPRFVESFELGKARSRRFYLVTEFIHGLTLEQERQRRRYTEDDVIDLAEELLGILRYLHSQSPPVVHHDIKPSNIIRKAPGSRLVLIDSGAVCDALATGASRGGTPGYMAPEQSSGGGCAASDLYALGALMVVCLTGEDPTSLMNRQEQLAWHNKIEVRQRTRRLLDALLHLDADERPSHAQVRAELRAARGEPAVAQQHPTATATAQRPIRAQRGAPPGPVQRGTPPGPTSGHRAASHSPLSHRSAERPRRVPGPAAERLRPVRPLLWIAAVGGMGLSALGAVWALFALARAVLFAG